GGTDGHRRRRAHGSRQPSTRTANRDDRTVREYGRAASGDAASFSACHIRSSNAIRRLRALHVECSPRLFGGRAWIDNTTGPDDAVRTSFRGGRIWTFTEYSRSDPASESAFPSRSSCTCPQ